MTSLLVVLNTCQPPIGHICLKCIELKALRFNLFISLEYLPLQNQQKLYLAGICAEICADRTLFRKWGLRTSCGDCASSHAERQHDA
jgi:hypothetical protein